VTKIYFGSSLHLRQAMFSGKFSVYVTFNLGEFVVWLRTREKKAEQPRQNAGLGVCINEDSNSNRFNAGSEVRTNHIDGFSNLNNCTGRKVLRCVRLLMSPAETSKWSWPMDWSWILARLSYRVFRSGGLGLSGTPNEERV
jgi:hypothetical protein